MAKNLTPEGVCDTKIKPTVQNNLKRKENGQNCYATHTCTCTRVHLTLRYKNPSDFYTQIPSGFVLRYVGAGRQPSADDRALRRKKTLRNRNPKGFGINPKGLYRWGPTGPIGQPKGLKKKKKINLRVREMWTN